jgi:hypothetical protein
LPGNIAVKVVDVFKLLGITLDNKLNFILQIQSIINFAAAKFNSLPACQFESLAIFAEPERGADFVLLEHFMFSN